MEYRVSAHDGYFELRLAGDIDPGTYPEALGALFGLPDWKPGSKVLVDEWDLRADDLTISGLKEIARICTNHNEDFGTARLSMYVSRELEFGLNRIWHVFVEGAWDVEGNVFRSREEAMAWLDEQPAAPALLEHNGQESPG
mgnify:CR=1 FL=1